MKYLCFILSFIVVALSAMPCTDKVVAIGEPLQASVKAFEPGNHLEHSGVGDACSPFCQCSCCNTPTISPITDISFIIPPSEKKIFPKHQPSKALSNFISIWQPPKLQA